MFAGNRVITTFVSAREIVMDDSCAVFESRETVTESNKQEREERLHLCGTTLTVIPAADTADGWNDNGKEGMHDLLN